MSLPASIDPAVLDTILSHLACLFVSVADATAARHAASQMLAAYDVETEQELGLAGDIISFGLHALQALSQAADPDLSLAKILRLRGSAVSLSRESHKSRRKLDQLQRARRAPANQMTTETQLETIPPRPEAPAAQPRALAAHSEAAAPQPKAPAAHSAAAVAAPPIEPAPNPIEPAPEPIESASKYPSLTWTQSYRQRQTTKRLAKKALKAEARLAAQHLATPAAT